MRPQSSPPVMDLEATRLDTFPIYVEAKQENRFIAGPECFTTDES